MASLPGCQKSQRGSRDSGNRRTREAPVISKSPSSACLPSFPACWVNVDLALENFDPRVVKVLKDAAFNVLVPDFDVSMVEVRFKRRTGGALLSGAILDNERRTRKVVGTRVMGYLCTGLGISMHGRSRQRLFPRSGDNERGIPDGGGRGTDILLQCNCTQPRVKQADPCAAACSCTQLHL
ncbi:hypothetical protein CALCODRAFT_153909 [Calocera cornea HHB12733]|uniref:Uncharacterized protein n=1 Tax=Calocera cornea HHB12733 TaxID=1353952 RepID=A0A165CM24_9BASI|nr:hypothetical protein CALCODRAFT_153909 [Calocera cornea HHB12733]